MRPILFNKSETAFDTYGLGELNVTKGTVTRERNGNYTLYAEIPVNDPMVSTLQKEMKLKADAGLRTKNQTFEISRIVKDSSNIVKIYGQHISHKLEYIVLRNATAFSGTAYNALAIWKNALIGDLTFDVWSDIQTSNKGMFDISKMENARLALGGVEGSILDLYGGEYEFDNMTIRLHKQLGRTAPTVLEYGRNILSAEIDETIEDAYTSVLPFATYTPETPEGDTSDSQPAPITVTIPENYVDSKYKALYAHRRIKVVDFSSEFSTDSKKKNIPNADKLRKLATDYMNKNSIGKPKINTKIEYVDLAKTLDYTDRAWIEELELCDIVPVYYPQIGLTDDTAKVTTITYDFVNERNESVEFGGIGTNVRASMQSGLAGKIDEVAKSQKDLESNLPNYLLNAQGNKVWYNRPDNKEHKVGDIWFEKNGLYDRMYVWNGSMWEKRIDTEDVDKIKKEVDKQLEQAKTTTDRAIAEANARSTEALAKAGASADLGREAKRIADENVTNLNAFKTTAEQAQTQLSKDVSNFRNEYGSKMLEVNQTTEGIKTKIGEITSFINSDGQRQEGLKRYVREETASLSTAIRETLSRDYIAKSTFTENAEGTRQRFEALTRDNETKLAEFRQGIDGQLTTLSSQIAGKVNETDFQRVKESSLLYERILGTSETDAPDKLSRLVMSSQLFQTEVGKYVKDDFNLVYDPTNFSKWKKKQPEANVVEVPYLTKLLRITNSEKANSVYHGFALPLNTSTFTEGEKLSYRMQVWVDVLPDRPLGIELWDSAGGLAADRVYFDKTGVQIITGTMTVKRTSNNSRDFPLEIWLMKNGTVAIGQVSLVRGDRPPDKFIDSTSTQEIATQTQVTQLAGSWAVQNLNGNGDVLNSINVLANGTNRIDGRLTHITGQTQIDDGVIKKSMIGKAQIGTAQIDEIDASKANLINVTSKNVATEGLTANIIKGGILSSLNGVTNFNLQTGWIDMNREGVGIRNQFAGRPLQYLVFGSGKIGKKVGTYTALMSNSHGYVKMDDGSSGIQIWNTNDNTTAVNIYGDMVEFMYNANDPKSIAIDTVKNQFYNIEDIVIKGSSLAKVLDNIFDNFRNLDDGRNYSRGSFYQNWR